MESTGEPNKIQISDVTASILKSSVKPLYNLTERSPIPIKGIEHMMSNYWIESMTDSHALTVEAISQNIRATIPTIVSNFNVTTKGKFPHMMVPVLRSTDDVKNIIKSNSAVSMLSTSSADIPTGQVSLSDMNRILDADDISMISGPTEGSEFDESIPIKVLIVCGQSRLRLSIVKLLVEVLGGGIHFSHAENRTQATEKILACIQNYSIVIVEESNDTINLLKWLKAEIKVPITVLINMSKFTSPALKSKFVDFLWTKQLPTKEEFSFSFIRSSNPSAVRLITHCNYKRTSSIAKSTIAIKALLIAPNLSKSKMVSRQLKSALSRLSTSAEVFTSTNGDEAVEMIYDNDYDMILIDNAFGADLAEVLHHLQYRFMESLKAPMIIGMSSTATSDYLIKNGADMIWQLPLPTADVLANKIRKFIHLE